MSVTYIVLNLLLQNEQESKKMESGSYDEKRNVKALSLWMQLLDILIVVKLACGVERR